MKKLCQLSLLLACLALVCLIQGCAVYSTASDERLVDTMGSDNAISGLIKKDLMAERFADGWNISVHCFYGHVFLVGECPKEMRAKAVKIAKRDKRVRSVTTHWFSPRVAETNNFVMATKLRSALIGTGNLNSTRIETEVNSDRVVLLGVANDSNERKTAVKAPIHACQQPYARALPAGGVAVTALPGTGAVGGGPGLPAVRIGGIRAMFRACSKGAARLQVAQHAPQQQDVEFGLLRQSGAGRGVIGFRAQLVQRLPDNAAVPRGPVQRGQQFLHIAPGHIGNTRKGVPQRGGSGCGGMAAVGVRSAGNVGTVYPAQRQLADEAVRPHQRRTGGFLPTGI